MRQLKVYETEIGFSTFVVATTSRKAALKIWGIHQDLFATGAARVVSDAEVIKMALASPGTVLRRPATSSETFSFAKERSSARPRKQQETKLNQPPPDRSSLTKAETALHKLNATRATEEAAFAEEESDLKKRLDDAKVRHSAAHKACVTKLADARRAYRAAGGED